MDLTLIFGVVKYGGILIVGLAIFMFIRKSGKNSQILKEKEASEKIQRKIDSVGNDTPDDTNDRLRDGDF